MRCTVPVSLPIALFVAASLGCSSPAPPAKPADAAPPPRPFLSQTTVRDDADVVVERVTYDVGGLVVRGEVCRPKGDGPFPLLVWAHGGFDGLGAEDDAGLCLSAARGGLAFVASSYRGEDGSDGKIEVCKGEVDDTRALFEIAATQRWARRDKATLAGPSHGGCVALRLAADGIAVDAVAALLPFVALPDLFESWREPTAARNVVELRERLEAAIGGSPRELPAAYAERDPLARASQLGAFAGKLLVSAAVDDELVPVRLACTFAGRLAGVARFRVTSADGTTSATAPPGCEGIDGLAFETGPRPTRWPGRRYFVAYDALGHGGNGPMGVLASNDFSAFLGSVGAPAP